MAALPAIVQAAADAQPNQVPRISVVIPALNEEGVVECLIEDLLHAPETLEIIVCDSGSTDGTADAVRRYSARHTNVRLVSAPKRGVSLARNCGAAEACGRYLVFLDADARIAGADISRAVDELIARDLAATAFPVRAAPRTRWVNRLIAASFRHAMQLMQYLAPTAPGSAGYIVRRDRHEAIGGYNECMDFGEDVEYLRRAAAGGKFRLVRTGRIVLDMRRFETDGIPHVLGKLCYGTLIQLFRPNATSMPFRYDFGHYEKSRRDTARG